MGRVRFASRKRRDSKGHTSIDKFKAERLLVGLENLEWPDKVKAMQTNWIGRSQGAEVTFTAIAADGSPHPLKIFTTRPDTLFGATYMVLAPEHPFLEELTAREQQN